jgi:dTDP-D-glucose 4,6-dehydratase
MTTALPNHENPAIADVDAREAADPRFALTNRECETEGGWGPSTQRKKQAEGCFNTYRDGTRVMNTAKSFYAHLRSLAAAEPRIYLSSA